jgi:hypothetical protein
LLAGSSSFSIHHLAEKMTSKLEMTARWDEIRGFPVISELYTANASDASRLPYDIRDSLGDVLLTTDFEQLTKAVDQKAFNDSIIKMINENALTQELWSRWLKVPLAGGGKLKKHSQRTLFEMLQATAVRERQVLRDLVKENEEAAMAKGEETEEKPSSPEPTKHVTFAVPEEEPSCNDAPSESEVSMSMKTGDQRMQEILALTAAPFKPRRKPTPRTGNFVLDLIAEFTKGES